MADKQVETTTYFVRRANNKEQYITVPAAWKVTFGPLAPGSKTFHDYAAKGWTLRFYEAKDKQRAVFTDVFEFRDMSIQITDKFVEEEVVGGGLEEGMQAIWSSHGKNVKKVPPSTEVLDAEVHAMKEAFDF